MKQLFTLCLALMSVTAMAQWPSLPYNPDENGDGLIGVVDLAALLAQYNTEFASAVVSEDGESAIVYMGEYRWEKCVYSCEQLPGIWRLPRLSDLHPVYSDVNTSPDYTWIRPEDNSNANPYFLHFRGYSRAIFNESSNNSSFQCYCAAKQLPRVEYSYCTHSSEQTSDMTAFDQCVSEKLALGWYPLAGFPIKHHRQAAYGYNGTTTHSEKTQASFWRWAE